MQSCRDTQNDRRCRISGQSRISRFELQTTEPYRHSGSLVDADRLLMTSGTAAKLLRLLLGKKEVAQLWNKYRAVCYGFLKKYRGHCGHSCEVVSSKSTTRFIPIFKSSLFTFRTIPERRAPSSSSTIPTV